MAEYDEGADPAPQQQPQETSPQQQESQQSSGSGGDSGLGSLLTLVGAAVAAAGYVIMAASFVAQTSYPGMEWTLFIFLAPLFLLMTHKSGDGKEVVRPFCIIFAAAMGLNAFFGAIVDAKTANSHASRAEAAGDFFIFLGEIACSVASLLF